MCVCVCVLMGIQWQMHEKLFPVPDMHRAPLRQQRRSTSRRARSRVCYAGRTVCPELRFLQLELEGDRRCA